MVEFSSVRVHRPLCITEGTAAGRMQEQHKNAKMMWFQVRWVRRPTQHLECWLGPLAPGWLRMGIPGYPTGRTSRDNLGFPRTTFFILGIRVLGYPESRTRNPSLRTWNAHFRLPSYCLMFEYASSVHTSPKHNTLYPVVKSEKKSSDHSICLLGMYQYIPVYTVTGMSQASDTQVHSFLNFKQSYS